MSERPRRERRTVYGLLVDPGLFNNFWEAVVTAIWDVVSESVEVDATAGDDSEDAWMQAHDRLVDELADQVVFETITAALPFLNGVCDAFGGTDYSDKPLDAMEYRAVDTIYGWLKQSEESRPGLTASLLEMAVRDGIAAPVVQLVEVRRTSVARFRQKIEDRDGARCRKCSTAIGPFDVDHVVPWAISRDDTLSNLQMLCRPCHVEKTKKDMARIKKHRDRHGKTLQGSAS